MEHLFEKLEHYASEDVYPYHMPGHKRRKWGNLPEALYKIDITEIEGFDNLHQSEGVLLELQKRASFLYGADESFYLVNGSTCGILSAVSSAVHGGGHLLMARNCHKSAYQGVYLRNLKVTYLYPPWLSEYDIFDAVAPEQIEEALEKESDINAVLMVSPTYEGRISDVGAIAEIVHKKGIPLIVDEAHGAHLGLAEGVPLNSCQLGADLVVHSVHKTLPALTQTALLHVNGSLINRGLLKRFLHIYQSSSPSYLLMASIDNALQYVEQRGNESFRKFHRLYGKMMEDLKACKNLKFLPQEETKQDVGKLIISVKNTEFTGKQLYDILLERYGLQVEMASGTFVLAMFTVNDGEEAYIRMTKALLELDSQISMSDVRTGGKRKKGILWMEEAPREGKIVSSQGIPLTSAWDGHIEQVSLAEGPGKFAGEFINLYPPGIPLVVPGEFITKKICDDILESVRQGLTVQGIIKKDDVKITERNVYLNILTTPSDVTQ